MSFTVRPPDRPYEQLDSGGASDTYEVGPGGELVIDRAAGDRTIYAPHMWGRVDDSDPA